MTKTVNISKRPTSIIMEQSHLAVSESMLHDIVGPISNPNEGPTLPIQLNEIVSALV